MALYRRRPTKQFEAFQLGSLEEKPEWLKAAYACGLVREWGHGQADGPFLELATARGRGVLAAQRGDYLVWSEEPRRITIATKTLFEATYEPAE